MNRDNSQSASVMSILASVPGQKTVGQWRAVLNAMRDKASSIGSAKRLLHSRPQFRLYVSAGDVKNRATPILSVRFKGCEVGKILVLGKGKRQFQCPAASLVTVYERWGFNRAQLDGAEWASDMITALCEKIRSHSSELPQIPDLHEHEVESVLLHEFLASSKPAGRFSRGILPVTIGGLPYQMPVPLSPSGHTIRLSGWPSMGHIDILARTRFEADNRVALAVMELKKPGGESDLALFQAFNYACALRFLMRDDIYRKELLEALEFSRQTEVPIRAVAVVGNDSVDVVRRGSRELLEDPLVRSGEIILGAMGYIYDPATCSIQVPTIDWDLRVSR